MNIVALSGSLRKESYNSAILTIAEKLFTTEHSFYLFNHLDKIPPFNPDIEFTNSVKELEELKEKINAAQLLIISTPEYIHSIPGNLKNLFDWLVGSSVMDGKKTWLIVATSSEGKFANEQLHDIVNVMTGGKVLSEHSLIISGIKTKFNSKLELIDETLKNKIQETIRTLEIL